VSDYIPRTADVRDAYSSESSDGTYANRMFDAWLARYKAKVVAKTEERIIKLLETHVHDETCSEADSSRAYQAGFEHGIALIKGENK
jgi:hypothetical protein